MNIIGTALERSETNKLYQDFKRQNLGKSFEDEVYEWKCWILKKYFKDNLVVNIIRFIIGIVLLILAGSSKLFKILGTGKGSSVIVIICLVLGVICTGAGILFSFSNYKCLKSFKDYLWDDDAEIATKIISFYDKAH